jgi:monomeric sarcosine oxidase
MAAQRSDVLVLGGGTMGTAAGWALARHGVKVTVLEQFGHVHAMGSHGGKTRIFRHAYAEGARYVPWTLQSDRLWTELQERTGRTILHRIGCIDISGPGYHRAREARASAEAYGIAHEWLSGADVNARWPIWNLPDDREVCYGPDAGFLDIAAALGAMRQELEDAGGSIREQTVVTGWSASEDGIEVTAGDERFTADRLVIAAGAWTSDLLADLGVPLEARRKPVLWFDVDAEHAPLAEPERMPVFISDDEHGEFYGIPHFDVPGVKVGMHSGGDVVDARTIDRTTSENDVRDDIWPFIQRNLKGFTGAVTDTAVCMYTMTPDEDFVIDRHPELERVAFAAGFSGHGFKFAPVIGDYLATLVTDPESDVVPDFALSRFAGAIASR